MLKILMITSMFCASLLIHLLNPLSFAIILLIQTLIVTLSSRVLLQSSWIPLTVFLVMVGGLMILFMYITSICVNKKFSKMKINPLNFLPLPLVLNFMDNFSNMLNSYDIPQGKDLFNMEFLKIFSPMNILSSNFMLFYLFIMLIIMIEILSLNKGPMRKKY